MDAQVFIDQKQEKIGRKGSLKEWRIGYPNIGKI